ncbi:histidine phosphatase family protein [Candidatus Dojkabacteria bacterium]|nr:histidine phosphatase family protein [Candidatus Dojkabacteria bacterium]
MQLILIRHSKTNVDPKTPICQWGLSEEGISLAQKLSNEPEVQSLDVIYSSLQTKALETALILAKPNAIPIKTDDNLTEVTSFTKEHFGYKYTQNVSDFYSGKVLRLANGESADEGLKRFNEAIEMIEKVETAAGIFKAGIVSHGNILSFYTAQFSDLTPIQIEQRIQMPDYAILDTRSQKITKMFGSDK